MIDTDALNELQAALIEPEDGGASYPSGLWSPQQVLDAFTRRQDEFLRRTQITTAWEMLTVSSGNPVVTLPADWIATLDAVFDDGDRSTPLAPADSLQADLAIPDWQTASALPLAFADHESADGLETRLMPVPDRDGDLHILYVSIGETITGAGVPFTVPDAFVPFIWWGVLADLLTVVSRQQDLPRAALASQHFEEGITIAQILLEGVV